MPDHITFNPFIEMTMMRSRKSLPYHLLEHWLPPQGIGM